MVMKRALGASSLLMLSLAASNAHAVPVMDGYIGADGHGYGDVIGQNSYFDVRSADVSMTGSTLNVSIQTNFAGRGDDGLFSAYTEGRTGIGYGDLFLSSAWTPYGSASNGYAGDDHQNGTVWSYGFALDDRWMSESGSGTGTLYALYSGSNAADTLLSDDFMSGAIYRNGQEVAVNTAGNVGAVGTGSWTIDALNGLIDFQIDLGGTSLLSSSEIGFHWGMTCGNDVIEGRVAHVPEPSALALMLAGMGTLAGTTWIRRKRRL